MAHINDRWSILLKRTFYNYNNKLIIITITILHPHFILSLKTINICTFFNKNLVPATLRSLRPLVQVTGTKCLVPLPPPFNQYQENESTAAIVSISGVQAVPNSYYLIDPEPVINERERGEWVIKCK